MPPYGGSIAQNVYYADADLCDADVDSSKGYPKREMENGKMKPWDPPFILMVDRGGCTFVKKVPLFLNSSSEIVIPYSHRSDVASILSQYLYLALFFRSGTLNAQEQLA